MVFTLFYVTKARNTIINMCFTSVEIANLLATPISHTKIEKKSYVSKPMPKFRKENYKQGMQFDNVSACAYRYIMDNHAT